MRVLLKGINTVNKRLADGRRVTYYYAWKGGPRLEGPLGSQQFIASYNAAVAKFRVPQTGVIQSILSGYQSSAEFSGLADRTRSDYVKHIKNIEGEFGDFPLLALADPRTRGEFLGWRDRLATRSRRQADYAFSVLARVLSWALNRGLIRTNPTERAGRLYRGTRAENVWSVADEAAFRATAPEHLHLALTLALWTGQRQGDLLELPWSAYDGATIRLRQSKTGVTVVIPVGAPLKAALDNTKKRSPIVLTNMDGSPWTADGFRSSWRKACKKAGVSGLTFHDLRGTAVTRLALVGATQAEIATLTGHSLKDVHSILDAHYLGRDPALALSAIAKLEGGTRTPN